MKIIIDNAHGKYSPYRKPEIKLVERERKAGRTTVPITTTVVKPMPDVKIEKKYE